LLFNSGLMMCVLIIIQHALQSLRCLTLELRKLLLKAQR
jgi:hypothetical protein